MIRRYVATQNVLDPRRVGGQCSGFSDEDVSKILCLLYPHSEGARRELNRIANQDPNAAHLIGRQHADNVNVDFSHEDNASNFKPHVTGDYAIILRLGTTVRNPAQGFTFGRNTNRCDVVFQNDPLRRLSNIHFRIYVNEYGVVMIEDTSTNGTIVDHQILKCKSAKPVRRTLTSGSIVTVLMHNELSDLSFLVRIPRREGDYEAAYRKNLAEHLAALEPEPAIPSPGGHLDLFPEPAVPAALRKPLPPARPLRTKTSERLPKDWDGSGRYNVSGTIGKGAFATVHMATSKFDGCPYAAKELEKRRFMKNGVLDQKVENEMKIMQSVQHENIVQYIEHFDWKDRLIIIMEYVALGDLGKYIMDYGPLSEPLVQSMASQLLGALDHLHSKNVTHRDIKPDNILISSGDPFKVKLTDFGLSKMVDNENTFLQTFCGTLLYCAPEVYGEFVEYDEDGNRDATKRRHKNTTIGQRYGHAVDIWSLGGVLFYTLTGSAPYPVKTGITYMQLLHIIMTTTLDVSPLQDHNVSIVGIDCLKGMINRQPERRATIPDLVRHKWLHGDQIFGHVMQSFSDEASDDGLEQSASQLRIAEREGVCGEEPNESYLEIEDNEENHTFGPNTHPARLFGEVGASAFRSSGAIPTTELNLPGSSFGSSSMAETEIVYVVPSSESEGFLTPRPVSSRSEVQPESQSQPRSQPRSQPMIFSMSQEQGVLDEIEPGIESQSLECTGLRMSNLNMKSVVLNGSVLSEFSSSKRKPLDQSDEDVDSQKPSIKRLRSEGQLDTLISDTPEEWSLFAIMPQAAQSRRQIDAPVHKSTFWNTKESRTWHLRYPEMVNSQYMAFKSAAIARREEFLPGKTPLWELAMKYFPPIVSADAGLPFKDDSSDGKSPDRSDSNQTPSDPGSPEEFPLKLISTQAIASLSSTGDSVLQDISIPISTNFVSFGRESRNTEIYGNAKEIRIPKNAFKVMLWQLGFDPATKKSPWHRTSSPAPNEPELDPSGFFFYISTKATHGITINKTPLHSHENKKPGDESKHWVRLFDGDQIILWRESGKSREQVRAIFRCSWGGSASQRSADQLPIPVSDEVASKLDAACARSEKAHRLRVNYQRAMERANEEVNSRRENNKEELQRKTKFEIKRQEAISYLMRRSQKHSPAPGAIPVPAPSRIVPQYRHTSPAFLPGSNAETEKPASVTA